MDELNQSAPILPLFALLPSVAAFVALVLATIARIKSPAARLVIFGVSLRYLLAALHTFTYAQSPVGLSWQALASVGFVAISFYVIRPRSWRFSALIAIAPFVVMAALSAVANGDPLASLNTIIKLTYFTTLMLLVCEAAEDVGSDRLLKLVLIPFSLPVVLQILSVVLGVWRGESADNKSYVGGYFHESGFAIILTTGLLIACLAPRLGLGRKVLVVVVVAGGIVLANYRTAILAMSPLLAAILLAELPARFIPNQRSAVRGLSLMAVVIVVGLATFIGADRFQDLAVALSGDVDLIKPPSSFTTEERRLLSARPYIWSHYYYGWREGTTLNHLIGFGPDAWVTQFGFYAHNTVLSVLFEMGLLGVFAVIFLWLRNISLALHAQGGRGVLIAGHVAFATLAMATMPLWQVEGLIFYAILCGITLYRAEQAASLRRVVGSSGRASRGSRSRQIPRGRLRPSPSAQD